MPAYELIVVIVLLFVVFAAFAYERLPKEMVAIGTPVLLLAFGILDVADVLATLSNSAPFTIACMFILAAALERTGCIEALGNTAVRLVGKRPAAGLALLVGLAEIGRAHV